MGITERLLADLRSADWQIAGRAAERLRSIPGESVTFALADALDAHDTAITDAAAVALILRDDWAAVEPMWRALMTCDEDVTDQIWSVVNRYPEHRISRELNRLCELDE